ncbi:MAG: hypothetical protein ACRDZO_28280 [Egibacteraceae bacterium]
MTTSRRRRDGSGGTAGLGRHGNSDPAEDLVAILMTQRMDSPQPSDVYSDFWTSIYQAIGD